MLLGLPVLPAVGPWAIAGIDGADRGDLVTRTGIAVPSPSVVAARTPNRRAMVARLLQRPQGDNPFCRQRMISRSLRGALVRRRPCPDGVAARLLGVVERTVGQPEQAGKGERPPWRAGRHAEGYRHRQPVDRMIADRGAQALGQFAAGLGVGVAEQHHELLAAQAVSACRPQLAADPLAHLAQHAIPGRVAVLVVDRLEVINVADEQRHRPLGDARLVLKLGHARLQGHAIEHPGQLIDDRRTTCGRIQTGDHHRDSRRARHDRQRVEECKRCATHFAQGKSQCHPHHQQVAEEDHQRGNPGGEGHARQEHRHDHQRQQIQVWPAGDRDRSRETHLKRRHTAQQHQLGAAKALQAGLQHPERHEGRQRWQ